MTIGELSQLKTLRELAGLGTLLDFLEAKSWERLAAGRHSIQGDDIYALQIDTTSRPIEGAQFESHRQYVDIHYVVEGAEMIGFWPTSRLKIARPYQESDDAELYDVPPEFEKLAMLPGRFALFWYVPGA